MDSENWPWFIPLFIGFAMFIAIAIIVEADSPQASSTHRLRLLFLVLGLTMLYAAPLTFIYKLESFKSPPFWVNGMACLLIAWGSLIASAVSDRKSLETTADSLSRPIYEAKNPNDSPNITPAERVRLARQAAAKKKAEPS